MPPGRALKGVLHVRMTPEMLAGAASVAKERGFGSTGDFVRHLILSAMQEEKDEELLNEVPSEE